MAAAMSSARTLRVIGVMSGTSVDGIDIGYIEFQLPHKHSSSQGASDWALPKLLSYHTYDWPAEHRALVFRLLSHESNLSSAEICRANFVLGKQFGDTILRFMKDHHLDRSNVDLIGSHGQTIWHDVQNGKVTSTLQIGEPSVIAEITGITTIADFRVADVAAGGQGAPLVSVFDWYFLRSRENGVWRALQNIGGIGNVSFVPPASGDVSSIKTADAPAIAFDTGPGNALIDYVANKVSGGKLHMDEDGKLAAQGTVNEILLNEMLGHAYFAAAPPKTTGRELFGQPFAEKYLRRAGELTLSSPDIVATFTELTARSIVDSLRFSPHPVRELVVAGGGANNPTLMRRLQQLGQARATQGSAAMQVVRHESLGVDPKAKEAIAFGFLAVLCAMGLPGNVPSCTGAAGPRVLGKICPGSNFGQLLLQNNAL